MAVIDVFRTIASEFNEVDDKIVNGWISLTTPLVSKKKFGELYEQAVALLVAHRMKIAGVSSQDSSSSQSIATVGDAAIANSYSEGGVSISLNTSGISSTAQNGKAYYALTQYGIDYLSLLRSRTICITIAQ